jgi:hypothetical protein
MLTQHEVVTAHEHGWSQLKNGELLDSAEREGFAVLVTTDANLKYQQNLTSRRLAIVVLTTTSWPRIQRVADAVVATVDDATAGSYVESRDPVTEVGKSDHRHFNEKESAYTFQTPEKLIADFQRDIARWNRENRNS